MPLLQLVAGDADPILYRIGEWLDSLNEEETFILLLFGVVFLCLTAMFAALAADEEEQRKTTHPFLPAEIAQPATVEYYREETERLYELAQKLDAETALARSYITATRTKAELEELTELLAHDRAKRALQRGR